MARREITELADLALLDGGNVGALFKDVLGRLMADVVDRPALKKDRTMTIELSVQPVPDAHGNLAALTVTVGIRTKAPESRTRSISMSWAAKKQALVWNDAAPDDVHQKTLDEEERRGK